MKCRLMFVILLSGISLVSFAQEKSKAKFGKVTPEDFKTNVYSIDSSAGAVVIADIGSTSFVGNSKGGFSLEFKKYKRVHVLNKKAYDIGNVEIGLYANNGLEEELNGLKVITYNLENGKVVETKLEQKTGLFKDKINDNLVIKKFTFPNIKEGSIIEYEYKIMSDFIFNLQPWDFQEQHPTLWSEYNVTIPEFYYYVTLSQGYQDFYIKDRKDSKENFAVSDKGGTGATERAAFSAGVTDFRWVIKDVPAIKEESYTSTINNHISRIEFQLAAIRDPFTPRDIMGTWPKAMDELLKDENFGYSLSRDNAWLSDIVTDITKGAATNLDKAKKIFAFVRDNMTCTNHNRRYLEKKLKEVLRSKNGSEAEINLLLTAMLLKAGFTADPVILSTRSHGATYAMYPLLNRFNYVISQLSLDGTIYYLDASQPRLGFARLGTECYNGHARVVDAAATPVNFLADALTERKVSSIIIINDDKGKLLGSVQQNLGYFESYEFRDRIKEKGETAFFRDIQKAFNAEIEIKQPAIDSLSNFDAPIAIHYDFELKNEEADIYYFNPMFGEGWGTNPFKAAQRFYPVEMPYGIDETYLLRVEVPKGYVVDEIPKQVVVKLNEEEDGMFEYRISQSDNAISLRSRIRLKRANYQPDEYEMLREFFNLIVKKHAEQIVFKKKK